jgi:transposase
LTVPRGKLEELYRKESNAKVKERLLHVIRVANDGELPAHVVEELHRSKPWASYWLQRYNREGIKGLQNKPKSGRVPQNSTYTSPLLQTKDSARNITLSLTRLRL